MKSAVAESLEWAKAKIAAYKILSGESVEKNILVPTFLIDKNNVTEYGLDGWQ